MRRPTRIGWGGSTPYGPIRSTSASGTSAVTDLQRPVVDLVTQLAVVSIWQIELVGVETVEGCDGLEEAFGREAGILLDREGEQLLPAEMPAKRRDVLEAARPNDASTLSAASSSTTRSIAPGAISRAPTKKSRSFVPRSTVPRRISAAPPASANWAASGNRPTTSRICRCSGLSTKAARHGVEPATQPTRAARGQAGTARPTVRPTRPRR